MSRRVVLVLNLYLFRLNRVNEDNALLNVHHPRSSRAFHLLTT
jgi:hypothetical protein